MQQRKQNIALDSLEHGATTSIARSPYERPMIQRVELAIDETLATGCKLGDDAGCVGPPVTAFEGGS